MPKRVLMVATVPSMIGQFNMDNIDILLELGLQVDVASDFSDRTVWPKEKVEALKAALQERGVECIQMDFSRSLFSIGNHLRSYREACALFRDVGYDMIHTHTPIASAIVRAAAHKTKTRVVYTAHGFHFYRGAPLKNWITFYPIEKSLSRWTDVLITINKEDYQRASEKFHAGKTVYIPGVGFDTGRFEACNVDRREKRRALAIPEDAFVLLSVGELSKRKNQEVILRAMSELMEENTLGNVVYLAVGTGDLQTVYEGLIDQFGLEGRVQLLGFRSDIDELCRAADCFVHPSVREGLGIAPLEAMASGLPLISADINGIKDYTEDGVTGCCIDPTSVEEMKAAIIRMRDDEAFRNRCGKGNITVAKGFDICETHRIMKDVYKDCLTG